MKQADQIFQLGEQLPALVRDAVSTHSVRLTVGASDSLPKLVVWRLLQPVIDEPHLRLVCHEGVFDLLLADLALHRLDVVLADRAAPANPNVRVYSHSLGSSPVAWYAPPALQAAVRRGFPKCLETVPVLLPTPHVAIRARLDRWLAQQEVQPRIAGEFEDSALLETFGASGMGVFPAAEWVNDELVARYGVKRIGRCEGVEEHFFAIGTEKRIVHPLVRRLRGL